VDTTSERKVLSRAERLQLRNAKKERINGDELTEMTSDIDLLEASGEGMEVDANLSEDMERDEMSCIEEESEENERDESLVGLPEESGEEHVSRNECNQDICMLAVDSTCVNGTFRNVKCESKAEEKLRDNMDKRVNLVMVHEASAERVVGSIDKDDEGSHNTATSGMYHGKQKSGWVAAKRTP
jgi:hypothetical protein